MYAAQAKLHSWSTMKTRIINQLDYAAQIHDQSPYRYRRSLSISSHIPSSALFSCQSLTKYQFGAHLQTFVYYRSTDEYEYAANVEDIIIASLFYNDSKDPRSALVVYFTSLNTGIIRRCLKYDFQFPSFQLLRYIPNLKLLVGYVNNRLYLLSNKNGDLKYITSISCPGKARKIIYDKTIRDTIYVGGDRGLLVCWHLIQDSNGYDLRIGERLKTNLINRQYHIIDMKIDRITHQLLVIGNKGCLIYDTLLNRETVSVLSAHGAPVTCANIYGYLIVMGFADGIMKIFEIGSESVPVRYQLKVHKSAMISLLITLDGTIITGADDGTVCFHSLDSLVKLGEYHFHESIERLMFVRGEDLLIKFRSALKLFIYTLPIRSFSGALESIEQIRLTFPVGSIPIRIVTRSTTNLFTIYNPRSTQIISTIPLSPDRILIHDFVYDSAGEVLYIQTNKIVCAYNCSSQPAYLINTFQVSDECYFTKLCCLMWFSTFSKHTRKRRAFGIVFVGTTNGKLYLIPGDHGLKYALLHSTPEAFYSNYQIFKSTIAIDYLEIFQSHETYTTRRSARYLLAIGNDFSAKFYQVSINEHEIFLRELGITFHLDAPCIGAAMAQQRIALACSHRGYIQMYAVTNFGLDEISPKDIIHEHSPIQSLTACDTLGIFATLNSRNEIMLWSRNNEIIKMIRYDIPLVSIANLNDRGDILLISNRRLNFLMISDFAPEQILFDLSKKTIKDDPIEQPKQMNKHFDTNTIEKPQTIRLNERTIVSKASNDVEETNTLGFFELLEQEKAQAEMKKMLAKKKLHPIAPDALIPNSTIRSMLKVKKYEPVQMKMFQLRLTSSSSTSIPMDVDDQLNRYSVLTDHFGIHSTSFQILNKLNKTNRNLNWQNEDDEWIEMGDPDGSFAESTSKPSSAKKSRNIRPTTSTLVSRQKDTMPDIFKRLKNEPWWRETDEELNSNLRSMLLQLFDIIRDKETDSYESACNYLVDIFRTFGIEPTLVNQILDILMDHLVLSENDPLDVHTVRTLAQFMIERKNIIINLLTFTSKYSPDNILRHEAINAIKFITDVNHTEDIELVLQNMPIVRDTAEDTFSLKTIIERIKSKQSKKAPSDLNKEGEDDETESLHPLLKKISEERWFPRDITTVTLDSILQAILTKLPNASKTLLKTLTTHLLQLNRVLGFSDEQFTKVAHSLISLLSHTDADYRLIAATILAELGRETKAIDIALLQSFLNDSRILVRTESCDTLKKLTGIHSDTVLKDCADDLAYLETLPEEDFTLQNYLKAKNRLPTPSLPAEQPIISSEDTEEQEKQTQVHDEQNDNNLDQPDLNLQDQTSPVFNNNENFSPSLTPHYDQQLSTDVYQQDFLQPTPNNLSITPSLMSSVTFGDQPIRVEISEKTKPFIALPSDIPQTRKETPPRAPPPSSFSQSYRPRKARSQPPTEVNNRTPIKITVSDQTTGKRSVLLPNNSDMWDSYGKQNESPDENSSHFYNSSEVLHDTIPDPIQNILDDHKRSLGYFRSMPNRRVLIPHKVSFDDVLAEQSHLTVDRKTPYRSTSQLTSTMQLSDLNRNKRHLHEVEFVQLLTSLVIRSVQIHKHHDRFIPGSFLNSNDFYWNFTNSLSISQMQLHSPLNVDQGSFYNSSYFPPVFKERSVADDITRMKSDAQAKAKRTGINLRKAKDMEDVLSHLLKSTRDRTRSTINPSNSPHPPPYISLSDPNEITHAWLLDQLLKSQGASESEHYIQQIIRAHPKFAPLLHSRIPEGLISIIWNDPVLKHLATIIGNKTDHSTVDEPTNKSTITKTSVPQFDEEHSSNFFDYAASSYLLNIQQQKEEQKKKFLPQIRGTKMRLPRHVVKFGFRELEDEPPETSLDSLRDENTSKTRRRRIYMHLMCNHYHSCL